MKSEITDERILFERRCRYNPLLGLRPQTLRSAIDAFEVGYVSKAARIWEKLESTDDTVIAVRPKRRKRVSRLSWQIVPYGAAGEETANAHAEVLEDFYNNVAWTDACEKHRVGGFSRLVEAMLDCIGKKYSVHEIVWNPQPDMRRLRATFKFVPLYFFENTTGNLRLLRSPNAVTGDELKPNKWLIAASDEPLMAACSVYYLFKQMSLADWLVFSRRFGSALAWLKTNEPEGTPKWQQMADMLANIDNESSLITGDADTLTLLQVSGQNAPFKEIIEHLTRRVITMWLGSDLATMSSQDGAGASLQGESAAMLEDDDCLLVEETLERTVSRFVVRYYFGDVEPAAYLQFQRTDRSDKRAALELLGMSADRGVAVSQKAWREASGIAAPDDGEPIIEKAQTAAADAFGSSFAGNETDDIAELSRAMTGEKKQKLLAELDRIDAMTDVSQRADALVALEKNLGEFFDGGDAEATALFEILKKRIGNEK